MYKICGLGARVCPDIDFLAVTNVVLLVNNGVWRSVTSVMNVETECLSIDETTVADSKNCKTMIPT